MFAAQRQSYPVYHIPRQIERHVFLPTDTVVFRDRLGKANNVVIDGIKNGNTWHREGLGPGPYTVMETADDQVKLRNEFGEEDIVPSIFLVYEHLKAEDDR